MPHGTLGSADVIQEEFSLNGTLICTLGCLCKLPWVNTRAQKLVTLLALFVGQTLEGKWSSPTGGPDRGNPLCGKYAHRQEIARAEVWPLRVPQHARIQCMRLSKACPSWAFPWSVKKIRRCPINGPTTQNFARGPTRSIPWHTIAYINTNKVLRYIDFELQFCIYGSVFGSLCTV